MKVRRVVFVSVILFSIVFCLQPRPEHPRPDFKLEQWQCLNGEWEFQYDPLEEGEQRKWWLRTRLNERVIVPFEIESELSGLRNFQPEKCFWYLKKFELSDNLKDDGRIILYFEAVDYHVKVWFNGEYLGKHVGGYSHFSFDITDYISEKSVLVLKVVDSNDQRQVRGKQSSKGKGYGIWYTPSSGIWQPVWIERVGRDYVQNFKYYFDFDRNRIVFEIRNKLENRDRFLKLCVFDPEESVMVAGINGIPAKKKNCFSVSINYPKLWSPECPFLYTIKFEISDSSGKSIDEVESYVGLREVKIIDGKICLNRKPIYQKMVLVQGYYKPGSYSPLTDNEFKRDLVLLKKMGFNGIRMHQKVEAKRFYYWADKIGVLVWQDMPGMCTEPLSMFFPVGKRWRRKFESEWEDVIMDRCNHPSLIVWVPFNESWGILPKIYSPRINWWAKKVVNVTRSLDSTRVVIDDSGWLHQDTDILDVHVYLDNVRKCEKIYRRLEKPWGTYSMLISTLFYTVRGYPVVSPLFRFTKYKGQPIVVSEYGGFGFYKTESKNFLKNFRDYTLGIGRYSYIQGYCYTQLYDVEQERNGLLYEDRSLKISIDTIRYINDTVGKVDW